MVWSKRFGTCLLFIFSWDTCIPDLSFPIHLSSSSVAFFFPPPALPLHGVDRSSSPLDQLGVHHLHMHRWFRFLDYHLSLCRWIWWGYYHAGDNLKSGIIMAFTMTMMSWSIIEYENQMGVIVELSHAILILIFSVIRLYFHFLGCHLS